MTDRSPSAGYLAFPDFHTAALWYALWGRPSPDIPPNSGGEGEPDDQPESEGESEDGEDNKGARTDPSESEVDTEREQQVAEDEESNDQYPEDGDDQPTDESTTAEDGDVPSELDDAADVDRIDEEEAFELTEPEESAPQYAFYHKVEAEDGSIDIIREFPSWYEFVMNVKNAPRGWTGSKIASRQGDNSFTGTESFDEAIDMALNRGWPEGRELLTDLTAQVAPRPQLVETWNYDVAGSFPSIPMYCAGDPACMVSEINLEQRNARPIVRIDMDISAKWRITQNTFMTHGAAMLSFAETLESYGYSTELRIIFASREAKITLRTSVVFKEAGQPLDLDRAAFAIAHPSTLRRLIFAVIEQHGEIEKEFKIRYGVPIHEPTDPTSGKPGGAIFIPGPKSNDETSEDAKRIVEEAAQAAGFIDETFARDQAA